ncbi:MAG: class I SAM-dependent methyltransferase [Azonexus sp.]
MQIANPAPQALVNETELMLSTLPLTGAEVLELGCGRADKTRALAANGRPAHILALEVDQIQHAKNLAQPLPGVTFAAGGAEKIPTADASIDIVFMFKSLHHVPVAVMDRALDEIARVLKPGGLAWISEPVYAGELNEVFKLFHDEKTVREAAFAALRRAIERGPLQLKEQLFFDTRSYFKDFAEFDARMLRVTHTDHRLSPERYAAVRAKFESYLTPDGATFRNPQRVDLLVKPQA